MSVLTNFEVSCDRLLGKDIIYNIHKIVTNSDNTQVRMAAQWVKIF